MNRFICTLLMIGSMFLSSCAQNNNISDMDKENNSALIVYYSETGTTEAIAKRYRKSRRRPLSYRAGTTLYLGRP